MQKYFRCIPAILISFILLLFLFPIKIAAQISIQYGDNIQGTINPATEIDSFHFNAAANDKITLWVVNTSLSNLVLTPKVEIYNPNGSLLKSVTGKSVRIDTTLATGTYTIWVSDDNGSQTGSYGLTLKRLLPITGTQITYDTTLAGAITTIPNIESHTFTAAVNDKITLWVVNTSLSNLILTPKVEIYNPDGSLLKRVTGKSVRIDTTLAAGTYTIWVSDDNGSQTGSYGLSLKRLLPITGIPIAYETTFNGTITNVPAIDSYTFTAAAKDNISLLLVNTSQSSLVLTPKVEIYNPDGSLLKTAIGKSIRIDTTLAGGTYTIWVSDDNGFQIGDYALSVLKNIECVQPDSCMISWWTFDEDSGTVVKDIISNYDGIIINGAARVPGKVGKALMFDGVDDYIGIPDNNKWAFGMHDFTVEMWAKWTSPGSGDLNHAGDVLIGNDEGPGNQNKWFFALGSGLLHFTVYNQLSPPSNFYLVRAPFSPVVGQWYHLAVTKQGTLFTIYVNGVAVGSEVSTSPIANANAPLLIGQSNEPFGGFMNGLLDEVTIYGRALSSSELLAIFQADSLGKPKNLRITTTSIPAVQLGDSLSFTFAANLGRPTYKWSIVQGYLPAGVTLDSLGHLKGIPNEANEFIFKVRVTDSTSNFAEKEFILQVKVTLLKPIININKVTTVAVPGRILTTLISAENTGNTIATDLITLDILDSNLHIQTIGQGGIELATTMIAWKTSSLLPGEKVIFSHEAKLNPTTPVGKDIRKPICSDKDYTDILECMNNVDLPFWCNVGCGLTCGGGIITCLLTKNCAGGATACATACGICTGIYLDKLTKCFESKPGCKIPPQLITRAPNDPNEKLVISKKFIQPNQILIYPIHFENIGNVEAKDIFVWDTLDNNLETSTLQILTPGATYNAVSRVIKWNLLNKNLQSGSTDNVLYSIKPKPNLPSGTIIKNKASIQFEIFDTVQTNEVINIIDAVLPRSSMEPLPAVSPTDFIITYSGTDSIGEIESYSIFVSENGEPFKLYKQTSEPFLIFTGEAGKTYRFLSIAKDQAGNVEVKNPIAEAITTVLFKSDSLCSGTSIKLPSNIRETGSTYQWQENNGTGYKNIADTGIFIGTHTDTLKLNNVTTSYYGYKYRCIITNGTDKDTSYVQALIFANTWTGVINHDWENAANWSCNSIPDYNTDVIIKNGIINNPILNSDRSCRSIKALGGISVTVTSGHTLTLTGPPK